jgi:hypothetical protein
MIHHRLEFMRRKARREMAQGGGDGGAGGHGGESCTFSEFYRVELQEKSGLRNLAQPSFYWQITSTFG